MMNSHSGSVQQEPQLTSNSGISRSAGCSVLATCWSYLPLASCSSFVLEFVGTSDEVRNCKKNSLLFFAPPCSTWVFLMLCCNSRSNMCGKNMFLHYSKQQGDIMSFFKLSYQVGNCDSNVDLKQNPCAAKSQLATVFSGHLHLQAGHGYHRKVIKRSAFSLQISFAFGCFICPLAC